MSAVSKIVVSSCNLGRWLRFILSRCALVFEFAYIYQALRRNGNSAEAGVVVILGYPGGSTARVVRVDSFA